MLRVAPSSRRRSLAAFGLLLACLSLVGASGAAAGLRPATGTSPAAAPGELTAARPPAPAAATAPAVFHPNGINIILVPVASGFSSPVLVTSARDGSGRLFVVEQTGKVFIIARNLSRLATPFLDLSRAISTGGERGLLGLAFHPSFRTNHKLYVTFTTPNGSTAINEYRVTTNPNRVSLSTGRRILTIAQPYANHNGGGVAFGRDGFLYIGMGDGGSGGDPGNRAQSLSSLLGKMLRIDVNGRTSTRAYRLPSSNPYVGRAGLDEIWSRGLRNPWRWSFDRTTGALWIGDVGQGRWEEIDRSTGTTPGRGTNYGWRVLEGRHCYIPSTGCNRTGKAVPVVEYGHSLGCSVTGGYVYRGSAQPILQGGYFFADYCSGRIWTISATAASPASPVQLLDTPYNISSFGEGQAGELYIVDHAGGGIYHIIGRSK